MISKRLVTPRFRQRHRVAFTLVEIMVAIVIIAILMAFLLPALSGVNTRAKISAVKADMDQLTTGIAAFKLDLGREPPSSLTFYEAGGAAWNVSTTDGPRSRGIIASLFPRFAFGATDFNQDGDTTDVITLDGAECLVFFLGGMPNYATGALTGFSKNPLTPFAPGVNNRRGPYFEFRNCGITGASATTGRFVDTDGDGFPEYLDPIGGQTQPYLYFATGYRTQNDGSGNWINADNWDLTSPTSQRMRRAYYQYPIASNAFPPPTTAQPHNASSFQIISAGFDYTYGDGGAFDPNNDTNNATMSTQDRDNITNFHSGMLRP